MPAEKSASWLGGREPGVELLLHLRELAQVLLQQAEQRRGALTLRRDVDQFLHAHDHVRLFAHDLDDAGAAQALRHRRHAAIGQLQRLQHARDDADLVQVRRRLRLVLGILLQHQQQVAVVRLGLGDDLAQLRRVEQQRHHQLRERHRLAQREHEQRVGQAVLHHDGVGGLVAVDRDTAGAGRWAGSLATGRILRGRIVVATVGAITVHGGRCRTHVQGTEGRAVRSRPEASSPRKKMRAHGSPRGLHATAATVPACPG